VAASVANTAGERNHLAIINDISVAMCNGSRHQPILINDNNGVSGVAAGVIKKIEAANV